MSFNMPMVKNDLLFIEDDEFQKYCDFYFSMENIFPAKLKVIKYVSEFILDKEVDTIFSIGSGLFLLEYVLAMNTDKMIIASDIRAEVSQVQKVFPERKNFKAIYFDIDNTNSYEVKENGIEKIDLIFSMGVFEESSKYVDLDSILGKFNKEFGTKYYLQFTSRPKSSTEEAEKVGIHFLYEYYI